MYFRVFIYLLEHLKKVEKTVVKLQDLLGNKQEKLQLN